MRVLGLRTVGRYAGRPGALRSTATAPRSCATCHAATARKGLTVCGPCLAVATEPRPPVPCEARWFAWHPLAGYGSRAVAIKPWVVSSLNAPAVTL